MPDEAVSVVAELDAAGVNGRVWLNGQEIKYVNRIEVVSEVGERTQVTLGVVALNGTRLIIDAPVTVVNTAEAPMMEQIAIHALSKMRNLLSVAHQHVADGIITDFMKEVQDVYTLVEATGHLGRPTDIQCSTEGTPDNVRGEDSDLKGDDSSSI